MQCLGWAGAWFLGKLNCCRLLSYLSACDHYKWVCGSTEWRDKALEGLLGKRCHCPLGLLCHREWVPILCDHFCPWDSLLLFHSPRPHLHEGIIVTPPRAPVSLALSGTCILHFSPPAPFKDKPTGPSPNVRALAVTLGNKQTRSPAVTVENKRHSITSRTSSHISLFETGQATC